MSEVNLSENAAKVLEMIEGMSILEAADLVKDDITRARVFLSGEIGKAVSIKGLGVTKGAQAAIEAAGGKVE